MPAAVLRLRVTSAFVAFHAEIGSTPFITIPTGSIIKTREQIGNPGLVQIQLDEDDQPLFAFARDINERAEAIDNVAK